MERLEHDADPRAPKARERVLAKAAEAGAVNLDRARIGPLKARHHHQQGGFARARRPDEGGCFAAPYFKRNPFEYMDPRRAASQA